MSSLCFYVYGFMLLKPGISERSPEVTSVLQVYGAKAVNMHILHYLRMHTKILTWKEGASL